MEPFCFVFSSSSFPQCINRQSTPGKEREQSPPSSSQFLYLYIYFRETERQREREWKRFAFSLELVDFFISRTGWTTHYFHLIFLSLLLTFRRATHRTQTLSSCVPAVLLLKFKLLLLAICFTTLLTSLSLSLPAPSLILAVLYHQYKPRLLLLRLWLLGARRQTVGS